MEISDGGASVLQSHDRAIACISIGAAVKLIVVLRYVRHASSSVSDAPLHGRRAVQSIVLLQELA